MQQIIKKEENLQKGIALFNTIGYDSINDAEEVHGLLGYIRPYPPELKLREHQYYRGVYCGVCRAMGRCTGQCSRMALSYDFVFLALTRLALANANPVRDDGERAVRFEKRRCLPHPFRRRLSLQAGDVTDYVACAAAMLNYHKLLDDKQDERGAKKARAIVAMPHFKSFFRRARKRFPSLAREIEQNMKRFGEIERTNDLPSVDLPADGFGEVLAVIFSHGLDREQARIAHHIGFHVGRWLYMIDAIDDYDEDVRRGRPNPLHRLYGEEGLTAARREHLYLALGAELRHAIDAVDLLDVDEQRCGKELLPLIYHMLETALPATAERILFPEKQTKSNKKASIDP